jgi:hypothetical protein
MSRQLQTCSLVRSVCRKCDNRPILIDGKYPAQDFASSPKPG